MSVTYKTGNGGVVMADNYKRAVELAKQYCMGGIKGKIDKSKLWCIYDPFDLKVVCGGFLSKTQAVRRKNNDGLSSRYLIMTEADAEQKIKYPKYLGHKKVNR